MARILLRQPGGPLWKVPIERPTRTALLYHTTSGRSSEAIAVAPRAQDVSTASFPKRITIADIKTHRVQQGRLMAGTAAYSDSDMFKLEKVYQLPVKSSVNIGLSIHRALESHWRNNWIVSLARLEGHSRSDPTFSTQD
jgi:hypothetical protein